MTDIPPNYLQLVHSHRVSRATREALESRVAARPEGAASVLTVRQMSLLRAVLARVVPQPYAVPIDIAGEIDAMLDKGVGDGWRIATQPPDAEAYRSGLNVLDNGDQAFESLLPEEQDAILHSVQAGRRPGHGMSSAQMAVWFTDLCADATRIFVSHPATLARMGFSGIGYGGDTERLPGFKEARVGSREAWEPEAEQ